MDSISLAGDITIYEPKLLVQGKVPMKYLSEFRKQFKLPGGSVIAKYWACSGTVLGFTITFYSETDLNKFMDKLPVDKLLFDYIDKGVDIGRWKITRR